MKNIVLKSKNLIITPMTDGELETRIENTAEAELKTAYGEMLDGCKNAPADRLWYTAWKIALKTAPDTAIGDICFKGPQNMGRVEVGYGIDSGYEGKGYMSEALKKLVEWATVQEDVYIVCAETAPDNIASQKVLEKCGFKPCTGDEEVGEEGPRFRYDKPKPAWIPIYMCFGVSIGCSWGMVFNSLSTWLTMGICLGLCVGALLDSREKKHRALVTGEKQA